MGRPAVGLFGGSFNPPHAGHVAASLMALRRCGLSRVWWLVTPGNPLKDTAALPPVPERIRAARGVARDARIVPTDLETRLGTRYTADLLRRLVRRRDFRFVLIIGADNLAQLHRWHDWQAIAALVPIVVVDRPGFTYRALASPAAGALSARRIPEARAGSLADARPPAWCFLGGLRNPLSSTRLRAARLS